MGAGKREESSGKLRQESKAFNLRSNLVQVAQRGMDVPQKFGFPAQEPDGPVSAEGLQQALNCAPPEQAGEFVEPGRHLRPRVVVAQQFDSLLRGKGYIRVVEERSQVVSGQTGPHPLEIDQVRCPFPDKDILRLQVAVD